MGKLLVLSLEESEENLYNKIMEIVNEAGINTDKVIDQVVLSKALSVLE